MSTTAPRVKAATTDEELRVQAYRLIVGFDAATELTANRDGKYWGDLKKKVIQKLKDRGTPENLGVEETVTYVMKNYREKETS